MLARVVAASHDPFSRRVGEFSDPGVARDEIASLRPHVEPVVLRVTAWGGEGEEWERAASLVGDWFCDADGLEPQWIPDPPGSGDMFAPSWLKMRPWIDAWERSESGAWSIGSAAEAGVGRRSVAAAAAACARECLDLVSVALRPLAVAALDELESWGMGGSTSDRVATAAVQLDAARWSPGGARRSSALESTALASVARACEVAVSPGHAAVSARQCADFVASALSVAYDRGGSQGKMRRSSHLAGVVRSKIQTADVLRSVSSVLGRVASSL